MICVFEVLSPEVPDFKRLIHIRSDQTFEDLHQIVQNASNFDTSQLASFFVADEHWRKRIEIGSFNLGEHSNQQLNMRNTKLNDYISESGQKLVYVFDFFNDRFFYLELKEMLMKTDLKEPFVAYEKGNAPSQVMFNDMEGREVDLLDPTDSYGSFGDLEDYCDIFGEMDA